MSLPTMAILSMELRAGFLSSMSQLAVWEEALGEAGPGWGDMLA